MQATMTQIGMRLAVGLVITDPMTGAVQAPTGAPIVDVLYFNPITYAQETLFDQQPLVQAPAGYWYAVFDISSFAFSSVFTVFRATVGGNARLVILAPVNVVGGPEITVTPGVDDDEAKGGV